MGCSRAIEPSTRWASSRSPIGGGLSVGRSSEVDGHDVAALVETFEQRPLATGRPTCVIARTHKGRGVSFIEDRVEWHHRVPTDAELELALRELAGERA